MMTEEQEPVAYEAESPTAYEWTTKAYDHLLSKKLSAEIRRVEGVRLATVSGDCPRCGDQLDWTLPLDGVVGTSYGPSNIETSYVPLDVRCQCNVHHGGAPAGAIGCGIVFRIEVEDKLRG